jgi:hypothetical protein
MDHEGAPRKTKQLDLAAIPQTEPLPKSVTARAQLKILHTANAMGIPVSFSEAEKFALIWTALSGGEP